jgi:signal transduction histidine kinase
MNSALLLINILVALSILGIGGISVLNNPNRKINRTFFYATVGLAGWVMTNYFSNATNVSYETALVINKLVLAVSGIAVVYLVLFAIQVTNIKLLQHLKISIASLGVISSLLTLTSLGVKSIELQGSVYAITFGPLSSVYFLVLLVNVLIIVGSLIIATKRAKKQEKSRFGIMLFSLFATLVLAVATNAAIPYLTGSFAATNVGPLFTLILSIGFSYAIVKHQLFDVRFLVVRSLAYILTLMTLIAGYILVIFGVAGSLLGTENVSGQQIAIYVIATLLFGLSLGPLKRFFDTLTTKLFYRDAYDTRELLDELNKILVATVDVKPLLEQSAKLLQETLKPEFCSFVLTDKEGKTRTIGASKGSLDTEQVHAISSLQIGGVITIEDLPNMHADIRQGLLSRNIALIGVLSANGKGTDALGYVIFGNKQSGNIYTAQDMQVLDIVVNELVIATQNALRFEEIQTFNITLQQKVDDATRLLRSSNEKLKALDETKDDFISMASHQLRTPLTAVKGYVSMVAEGDAGKLTKQQKELLEQAFLSSQRMVYLISDLLNVSRLRTGKFVIENKPTNLAEVIATEVNQLQEAAKSNQQTLEYKKPTSFPELNLDETKIRQVIMNFMDNALHYTPKGGRITVILKDTGKSIEFTVEDNGIGIPKAEQKHLFSKFFRAQNAKKARPDGTGLGLFMAKKVIIAQGGAVIFSSDEGKGSTFGFTIPKKALMNI